MNTSAKSIYILGTGVSHDGSTCLLKDGEICVAIEKERVTRVKHDGFNDLAGINYCLATEGITMDDVALLVQNANFGMMHGSRNWWYGSRAIPTQVPVVTISHHLAHAYSAIGTCPYQDTAVLVIDGCGSAQDECLDVDGAYAPASASDPEVRQLSFEKDSFYMFRDGKMTAMFKDFSPWGIANRGYPMCPHTTRHSIGGLYSAVSGYVFRGLDDPGKLMGLAAYGRAGVHEFQMFDLREGRVFVRYDWMERFDRPAHTYEDFLADFEYYADLAYWTQREIERAILYVVNSRSPLAGPCENLCYAGGVALNAVANRRILKETSFKNVYIQPAAGDNGLALGCAYYGWIEKLQRGRRMHNRSFSFGRVYPTETILQSLQKNSGVLSVVDPPEVAEETARHLAAGTVVGWFQDGSEFGPRALGFRSILADPRRKDVGDFINRQVKRREDFRPFAPSVLAEDVGTYFDCDYESPHMLLVAPVRQEYRDLLSTVVARDGSARIQTVTETSGLKYWTLLRCFRELTGISVVLNTSFNRRGMPIVETPEDAIAFFLSCPLDVLVMGRFLITKKVAVVSPEWPVETIFKDSISLALERNRMGWAQLRGVYQVCIPGLRTWTIDLSKERPVVAEGIYGVVPDGRIELSATDFRRMYADPFREGSKLAQEGKMKVDGNAIDLMRILTLQ